MPFTARSFTSVWSSALSAPNLPRFRVLPGEAKRQPASQKAVPMVWVPRSSPSSAPPLGRAVRNTAVEVVISAAASMLSPGV